MRNSITTRSAGAILAGTLLFGSMACQAQTATSSDEADTKTDAGAEGQARSKNARLPAVQLEIDEAGPETVNQAVSSSDYVVVAQITSQRDGARYFGGSSEASGADEFEAVEWTAKVEEWRSGDPTSDDELKFTGTAYTVDSTTKERTGTVQAEGVDLPLQVGARYVLFLERQPEPWGLSFVSAGASLMQLDRSDTIVGEVAPVFDEYRGDEVDDVLPEGS